MYRELENEPSRPGEIILGNGKLTAIFLASAVICGTCFGLGYSFGKHTSAKAAEAVSSSVDSPGPIVATVATEAKPSPELVNAPAPVSQPVSDHASGSASANTYVVTSPARQPANPAKAAPPLDDLDDSVPIKRPLVANGAVGSAGDRAYIVQVAAISRAGDADILVAALHRKGYEVNAIASSQDHLVHIQVGPFRNQKDAQAMRDRLSNDGYTAILK